MAAQSTPTYVSSTGSGNGMSKKQYVWYFCAEALGDGETMTVKNEDDATVAVLSANGVARPVNCKTKLYMSAKTGTGNLVIYTQKPGARFSP